MLILSDFRDYYDNIMHTGIDKRCIYNRNTTTIHFSESNRINKKYGDSFLSDTLRDISTAFWFRRDISVMLLGFCGTFHPMIYVSDENKYFYNYKEFEEYIDTISRVKGQEKRFNSKVYGKYTAKEKTLIGAKKLFAFNSNHYNDIFYDMKTPVVLIEAQSYYGSTITINPMLDRIGFGRIKDSYSCYQEIYQFMSGVLGVGNRPMVEISNNDMIVKKGFDLKTSFRHPIKLSENRKDKKKK